MKNKYRFYRVAALAASLLCAIALLPAEQLFAKESWPKGPSIVTPYAIVMEANTGTVLYEKDSHVQSYPASITKIMTALLAVENCDMDEIVTFSQDAVYKNEGDTSHISRDVGEEMTMEQCLYAVMLASANECAYAVAEHVAEKKGGDYRTFIDMMNERAKELGCKETNFNNCNGLPDTEHLTSCYDMALIAADAYKNETFRIIAGTKKYTIPQTNKHDEETPMVNHHNLLYPYTSSSYLYDYCKGGKTGYTSAANSTLVTYAEKDGMTLVCVVMKTDSPNQFKDTITLLDYCFDKFQVYNISGNETSITSADKKEFGVLNSNPSFVTFDADAYIILPKKVKFTDAALELEKTGSSAGAVAEIKYSYADRDVGSAAIVASNAKVENSLFGEGSGIAKNTDSIVIRPIHFLIALLIILALVLLIFLGKKISDEFYMMRHRRQIRRMERERFSQIRKKHRRRKKDRLFR